MMSDQNPINDEQLLGFFKALADANRLKIIGLLAQQPRSVEELAALLEVRPSTVSHHLMVLVEAGLVHGRAQSYYNVYQLTAGALENLAKTLLAQEALPQMTAQIDLEAYDRKVLRDFLLPDGRLKILPAQRKKRSVVLRHVAQSFEPGRRYSEAQVNEILERFHEDIATLRREMIVDKILERENDEYWRAANGA